jgi:hypothetical protein
MRVLRFIAFSMFFARKQSHFEKKDFKIDMKAEKVGDNKTQDEVKEAKVYKMPAKRRGIEKNSQGLFEP